MSRVFAGLVALIALAGCPDASAGGIADEPCPNVRGEHTNTCPPGTVGAPYSLRFVESEGAGCGPGSQTFHLDSGLLPPGLTLAEDGSLSGVALEVGSFRFYVEMRERQDDPSSCAGKRSQKQLALTTDPLRRVDGVARAELDGPRPSVWSRLQDGQPVLVRGPWSAPSVTARIFPLRA
jgi:hypothetical protein